MASDNSAEGDKDAAALAGEVKALRGLLETLQSQLNPAVQSSLRERSDELQRPCPPPQNCPTPSNQPW